MPLIRGRKRRAEQTQQDSPSSPGSSPEPATQRRRISPASEPDYAPETDNGARADSSQEEMVKKMVRLALACEYQRKPIRRADMSEKVLGSSGARKFKEVFNATQVELRSVFGMEMVELPGRDKVTVAQKRAAQKSQASQAAKPTPSWVLVSVLPSQFRDPDILLAPAAPTAEEESKYTSIYTILVSLISLSGGSLPEAKMERYLRRLGIEDTTPLSSSDFSKTERLFKRMEKDGYVVKVKESSGTGEDDVYWTVGPRGKVEVGESGVRGITKSVYGEMDEDEEEELERKIARSLGIGEQVQAKAAQQNSAPKKRGRKKKNADEDEEGQEGSEGSGSDDE